MREKLRWLRKRFDEFLDPEGQNSKDSLFFLFVGAATFFVALWVLAPIIFLFGKDPGTFGDFIGGTLNPILTFLTFMALLITIVLQQTELRATKDELAKSATALENQIKSLDRQNFEATFFQMLNMFQNIAKTIEISNGVHMINGQQAIDSILQNLKGYHQRAQGSDTKKMYDTYDNFWSAYGGVLSSYYRYLESMITFIESSDVDPLRYIRFLKASMSESELVLLFYRSLLDHGEKLLPPVLQYAMLEGMTERKLAETKHRNLMPAMAFDERRYVTTDPAAFALLRKDAT